MEINSFVRLPMRVHIQAPFGYYVLQSMRFMQSTVCQYLLSLIEILDSLLNPLGSTAGSKVLSNTCLLPPKLRLMANQNVLTTMMRQF